MSKYSESGYKTYNLETENRSQVFLKIASILLVGVFVLYWWRFQPALFSQFWTNSEDSVAEGNQIFDAARLVTYFGETLLAVEALDTDQDSVPDLSDLDDDNDGVPDTLDFDDNQNGLKDPQDPETIAVIFVAESLGNSHATGSAQNNTGNHTENSFYSLALAPNSVTSLQLVRHSIEAEDIDTNSVTSRTIRNGTILGEDISRKANVRIHSLRVGELREINDVPYQWTDTQGAANTVLINNGSGALSWNTLDGSSITADSLDFTEFQDALDLDASTDINLGVYTLSTSGVGPVTFGNTGTFTVAGNVDFNGAGINDIAGTLNLSGSALTSSSALNITPAAGNSLNINLATTGNFTVNGDDLYVDTSTGNVGIGVSVPTEKLEVNGVVRVGTADDTGLINLGDTLTGSGIYTTGIFRGGLGTTAGGGYVNLGAWEGIAFNTSGTWLGSQATRMVIDGATGNVGIGDTTPASLFTVGSGDVFQVNASGDIVSLKGLTYSWPTTHETNGVLTNTGTGILAWATLGGGSITPNSLDFTEFQPQMDLDTSTDILVDGAELLSITNTGTNNSFQVNDAAADATPFVIDANGNVGIGDATPAALLTVGTGDVFQVNAAGAIAAATGITSSGTVTFSALTPNRLVATSTGGQLVNTIASADLQSSVTGTTGSGNLVFATSPTLTTLTVSSGGIAVTGNSTITGTLGSLTGLTSSGTITFSGLTTDGIVTVAGGVLSSSSTIGAGSITADSLDFTEFQDQLDLDASTDILVTGSQLFSVTNTGTGNSFQVNDQASDTTPFVIDANGNVGIGVLAPAERFSVLSTDNSVATNVLATRSNNLSQGIGIGVNTIRQLGAGSSLLFETNATTRMTILGNGNIGIGVTPASKFDVSGGVAIGSYAGASTAPANGLIVSGNVGIGDSSPASLFTVGSGDLFQVDSSGDIVKLKNLTYSWPTAHTTNGVLTNNGSGTLTWGTLGGSNITADSLDFTEFQDQLDLDASTDILITGSQVFSLTNTGTGNSFQVNDQASDTTPFVIGTSGLVGIGTASPSDKLEVNGGIRTTPGSGGILTLFDDNVTRGNRFIASADATGAYIDSTYESGGTGDLTLKTIGSARITIKQLGNVGIGDTTPASLFTVGSGDLFQVNSSGDIVKLKNLTYSWPSSHTTNGVLTNNGSGTLTWGTLGASNITADSLDFSEFQDQLDLDASTDILVTGSQLFSVTNTGTGNSFQVNDQASDTTPFVIDANGNVGIGTTTPGYPLDVNGSVNAAITGYYLNGAQALKSDGTNFYLNHPNGNAAILAGNTSTYLQGDTLLFRSTSGSTEYMRVNSSGQLGIGTTNPAAKLEVNGNIMSSGSTAGLYFSNRSGTAGQDYQWYTTGGIARLYSQAGSIDTIAVTTTGNVGIGTTAPGAQLTVAGGTAQFTGNSAPTSGAGVEVLYDGTEGVVQAYDRNTATGKPLWLNYGIGNTILGGNVGIGTTSPSYKLTISSAAATPVRSIDISGSTTAFNYASLSNTGGSLWWGVEGSSAAQIFSSGLSYASVIGSSSATALQLASNATVRMTIDSSGNVGIGTTNPLARLSVVTSGITGTPKDGILFTYDSSNNYRTSLETQFDGSTQGNNKLNIKVSDGTSAGQTTVMSLLGNGNVGIGTTTPLSSSLTVTGKALFVNSIANDSAVLITAGTGSYGSIIATNASNSLAKSLILQEYGGNVGIGTTTPSQKLEVYQGNIRINSSDQLISRLQINNLNGREYALVSGIPNVGQVGFTIFDVASSSSRMVIDATGNVGIGVTNPVYNLHIGGVASPQLVLQSNGANGTRAVVAATNTQVTFGNTYSSSNVPIVFGSGMGAVTAGIPQNEWMRIDTSGNVGIGTTSPSNALSVTQASGAGRVIADFANSNRDRKLEIVQDISGDSTSYIGLNARESVASSGRDFVLQTGGTERMRVAFSTGNVGIGTTTPGALLTVSGPKNTGILRLQATDNDSSWADTDRYGEIQFYASDVSDSGPKSVAQIYALNRPSYAFGGSGSLVFTTANAGAATERMRINYDGKVGIGTTTPGSLLEVSSSTASPGAYVNAVSGYQAQLGVKKAGAIVGQLWDGSSAGTGFGILSLYDAAATETVRFRGDTGDSWVNSGSLGIGTTTPSAKLHLNNGFLLVTSGLGYGATFQNNAGNGSYITFADGTSSSGVGTNNGNLIFYNANNTTERMRINSSGNVGIGTTNPSAGKLVVQGSGTGNVVLGEGSVGSGYGAISLNGSLATANFYSGPSDANLYINRPTGGIISFRENNSAQMSLASGGAFSVNNLVSCGGIQTNASGTMSCTSDARLKNIDRQFTAGLAAINQITPQTYSWKSNSGLYDGGVKYSGFIAQNIGDAIPEAMNEGANGYKQINTTTILAASINAIKELSAKSDSLTLATTGLDVRTTQVENKVADIDLNDAIAGLLDRVSNVETDIEDLQEQITLLSENQGTGNSNEEGIFENGISVNGLGLFNGIVNFAQSVVFNSTVQIKNGLVATGVSIFEGVLVQNSDAAGYVTIETGTTEKAITFKNAYPQAPVVTITPNQDVSMHYYVSDVTDSGFVVHVTENAPADLQFSWHAVVTAIEE